MAAPHVSAVAALIRSVRPNASPAEVRDILVRTSVDIGVSGRDDQFGYGLVDAAAAVRMAAGLAAIPPTPETTPTPSPRLQIGAISFGRGADLVGSASCDIQDAGQSFAGTTRRVYYRYDTDGAGVYTRRWSWNGSVFNSRDFRTSGSCAWSYLMMTNGGMLTPGTYRLELLTAGQVVQSGTFTIQVAPTATPSPTPTPPPNFAVTGVGFGNTAQSGCILGGGGGALPAGPRLYARFDVQGSGVVTSSWYQNGRLVAGPSRPLTVFGPRCYVTSLYSADGTDLPPGEYRFELRSAGVTVASGSVTLAAAQVRPTSTSTPRLRFRYRPCSMGGL